MDFLEPTAFEGKLTGSRNQTISVRFEVSSGSDCRLKLKIDPIPIHDASFGGPTIAGEKAARLSLTGEGKSGEKFESKRVYLVGVRPHVEPERAWGEINLDVKKARIVLPTKQPEVYVRLYLRGFRSWPRIDFTTALGQLWVRGSVRRCDPNDVAGYLHLLAGEAVDPSWRDEADDLLEEVRLALSFARGGELHAPLLILRCGDTQEMTFYDGCGTPEHLPIIQNVDYREYVQSVIRNLERNGAADPMIWKAAAWMNVPTSYGEVRFLSGMTALETIVSFLMKGMAQTCISKEEYNTALKEIKEALGKIADHKEAKDIILKRLPSLNNLSLKERLLTLMRHIGLPVDRTMEEDVGKIIGIRNDIVHRGKAKREDELHRAYLIVREVLTQIFLSHIGYVGMYESYHRGYKKKEFPRDAAQ